MGPLNLLQFESSYIQLRKGVQWSSKAILRQEIFKDAASYASPCVPFWLLCFRSSVSVSCVARARVPGVARTAELDEDRENFLLRQSRGRKALPWLLEASALCLFLCKTCFLSLCVVCEMTMKEPTRTEWDY